MKRIITIAKVGALLTAAALVAVSCGKTVTTKKVDGEWKLTSGSVTNEYNDSDADYSVKSETTFDGTNQTTTTTVNNDGDVDVNVTEGGYTSTVSFDKKTSEYTNTTVATQTDDDHHDTYYYDTVIGTTTYYMPAGMFERTTVRTSTDTEEGLYTITGDAGDEIEKNSQIVFHPKSKSSSWEEAYTYREYDAANDDAGEALDIDGYWVMDYNSPWDPITGYKYIKIPTSDEGSDSWSGNDSEYIWNVTELKKGEMTVEINSGGTSTDDDGDSVTNTSTGTLTLMQE